MDSKTVRLAILFSIAAVLLILLSVYAASGGSRRRAARSGEESTADGTLTEELLQTGDAASAESGAYLQVIGENFTAYGEQIGNQPKAFMYDENFFDPMRDVGKGISEGDEARLTMQAAAQDDTIHVSILNDRGGLEEGVAFQVVAEQVAAGKEKTWTDTDRDGQLDLTNLASGNYRLRLLEVQGYEVPDAPVVVKVDALVRETPAAGAGGSADTADTADSSAEAATDGATTGADAADTAGSGATGTDAANTAGSGAEAATTGSSDFGEDRW